MKKGYLFSVLLLILFISNSIFAQMEIQTGSYKLDPSISNFNLANGGDQERFQQLMIYFPKPFKTVPKVIISVTKYDGDKGANTRFDIKVNAVTKTTMQLEAKTWGGSKIYLLAGEWMAIGE